MTTTTKSKLIPVEHIRKAQQKLKGVVTRTPLTHSPNLSREFGCNIYLKREDLQVVRSYKLRGAYNKISSILKDKAEKGIVAASAGNHAQGVAYSCHALGIHGKIYMPNPTTRQKIDKVKMFGREYVEIVLTGDTYDDAYRVAMEECRKHDKVFIHPFEDEKVIEGQGTVGLEILEDMDEPIDFLFLPIGGGGLASGVGSVFKQLSPATKVIGVEPEGAPAMKESLRQGKVVTLDEIDNFVDGAAVKQVGELTFSVCREALDDMTLVPEGKICTIILRLYNEEGMVVEPAGALTISALDFHRNQIEGKNVVCLVSGGNNDIMRTAEIKERSLLYEGLKHYFIIRFPQRAGALREFLNDVLGPTDDICHFEYTKKNSRESGPALIGIELVKKEDYHGLIQRMKKFHINYEEVNNNPNLFNYFI
ncbi:MAG: L-threonine dehydratase [Chitinophagales bacterium]|nr:MAG: L-threonine dehydratase [Chitinophagales bacterium]